MTFVHQKFAFKHIFDDVLSNSILYRHKHFTLEPHNTMH